MVSSTAATSCTPAESRFPALAPLIRYLDGLDRRADLGVLTELLQGLSIRRADIEGCCTFGLKGYRRNTICESGWYELLALCWRSGDRTPIHDHQGVSCAFRVVEGEGTEIRFRPTASGLLCPVGAVAMQPGYVCAAEDVEIHQVANMQAPGQDLVTLHIYSPPIKSMNTYEFASPITADTASCYAAPGARARDGGVATGPARPTEGAGTIPC